MVPQPEVGLIIFGLGAASALLATASTKRNGMTLFIGKF